MVKALRAAWARKPTAISRPWYGPCSSLALLSERWGPSRTPGAGDAPGHFLALEVCVSDIVAASRSATERHRLRNSPSTTSCRPNLCSPPLPL